MAGAYDGSRAGRRLRRLLRRTEPDGGPRSCTATSPASAAALGPQRRLRAQAAPAGLGAAARASPRSRGPSTRWSAATRTSTWPSSAAVAGEYLPNFYGGMHDGINGGDESDRLLVHWDLASPDVSGGQRRPAAGRATPRSELAARRHASGCAVGRRPAGGRLAGRRHGPGGRAARHRGPPRRWTRPAPGSGGWPCARCSAPLMAGGGRVAGFDRAGWYVVDAPGEDRPMKLTGVELRRIRMPLVAPFRTSFGVETEPRRPAAARGHRRGRGLGRVRGDVRPALLLGVRRRGRRRAAPLPHPGAGRAADGLDAHAVGAALAPFKGHRMAKAALEMAVLDAELRAAGPAARRASSAPSATASPAASRSASWTRSASCSTRSAATSTRATCGSS